MCAEHSGSFNSVPMSSYCEYRPTNMVLSSRDSKVNIHFIDSMNTLHGVWTSSPILKHSVKKKTGPPPPVSTTLWNSGLCAFVWVRVGSRKYFGEKSDRLTSPCAGLLGPTLLICAPPPPHIHTHARMHTDTQTHVLGVTHAVSAELYVTLISWVHL